MNKTLMASKAYDQAILDLFNEYPYGAHSEDFLSPRVVSHYLRGISFLSLGNAYWFKDEDDFKAFCHLAGAPGVYEKAQEVYTLSLLDYFK